MLYRIREVIHEERVTVVYTRADECVDKGGEDNSRSSDRSRSSHDYEISRTITGHWWLRYGWRQK